MRTMRVQFEGVNGILAILARKELETAETFNARFVAKRNELEGRAVRAKLAGETITGEWLHETLTF